MEHNAVPLDKLGIPPELARYVDASSPKEIKLMAARGLMPAPPKVLISIQYCLLADPEPTVAAAGREGLLAHPVKHLQMQVDDRTHPKILEFYAFNRHQDEVLVEHLLLRRQLSDRAICYLAEVVSPKLLEIVASNQERLLTTPAIYEHIKRNPAVGKALLDRTESFLRMNGALEEQAAIQDEKIQQVIQALTTDDEATLKGSLAFKHGFEEEGIGLPTELVGEKGSGEDVEPPETGDLWSTVNKLPTGKKIKLAYFGNASVRAILVRDTNKVVATAVIKSPRLTENEAIGIARNRNVCADVLRAVARNKELFKLYAVKLALVTNPKCPASVSLPIVSQLMPHDLKTLASNRNVPSVIASTAKQSMNKKAH